MDAYWTYRLYEKQRKVLGLYETREYYRLEYKDRMGHLVWEEKLKLHLRPSKISFR